jgi:YbbR domain-containing protein
MFKDIHIKIFFGFLASVFWVFVVMSYDQIKILNYGINIDVVNLNDNIILLNQDNLPKIKIYYKMTSQNINTRYLKSDDFYAKIDLEGFRAGKFNIPIILEANHPEIEIANFTPNNINITLENKITKEFAPNLITQGKVSPGYKLEKSTTNIEKILVSGAESIINQINKVQAIINLSGSENSNQNKIAQLNAVNKYNTTLEQIKFDPEFINTNLEIILDERQKTVGIMPDLERLNIRDGFFIKNINIDPPTAIIRGQQHNLKDIEYLSTVSLIVNNLDRDYITSLDLDLPPDISILEPNDNKITLSLELTSMDYQKEVEAFILTKNLDKNYDIEYKEAIIVKVTGNPDKLRNLKGNDIIVNINFSNNNKLGKHLIELNKSNFIYPQDINLIDFSPKIWEVRIKNI